MHTNEPTDEECLRLMVQGGKPADKAVAVLYLRYRRPVIAYFVRNRVDEGQAEDLLQEIFISIARRAQEFRNEAAAKSWVWAIARNRLIDMKRARNPDTVVGEEEWETIANTQSANLDEPAAGHSLDDCVSRALQEFSRKYAECAEALRRAALDGLSVNEVATFLGRTPGATREFLNQCRKRFRPFVEHCQEFLAS